MEDWIMAIKTASSKEYYDVRTVQINSNESVVIL